MSDKIEELERRIDLLERALGFHKPTTSPGYYWPSIVNQPRDTPLPSLACPKCGMKFEGANGYVCPANDCPVQPKAWT